jgi:hypothetical protein
VGCSPVVEHVHGMCETLSSVATTTTHTHTHTHTEKERERERENYFKIVV